MKKKTSSKRWVKKSDYEGKFWNQNKSSPKDVINVSFNLTFLNWNCSSPSTKPYLHPRKQPRKTDETIFRSYTWKIWDCGKLLSEERYTVGWGERGNSSVEKSNTIQGSSQHFSSFCRSMKNTCCHLSKTVSPENLMPNLRPSNTSRSDCTD